MLIKYWYLFMTQKTVYTDIKYCTRGKTLSLSKNIQLKTSEKTEHTKIIIVF